MEKDTRVELTAEQIRRIFREELLGWWVDFGLPAVSHRQPHKLGATGHPKVEDAQHPEYRNNDIIGEQPPAKRSQAGETS